MAITKIQEAPSLDSFTPLSEHQSQTPSSFYNAKPILYYHDNNAQLLISSNHRSWLPIPHASSPDDESQQATVVDKFETFISTENITLFNAASSVGVSIPYPSVSLHAIQRLEDPADSTKEVKGLYMQLEVSFLGASQHDNHDLIYPDMTIIPSPSSDPANPSIQLLFDAVSACCNLYPDTFSEADEEMEDVDANSRVSFQGTVGYEGTSATQRLSSLDETLPSFPGSGGWITAENVSDYFDSDGNWIGGGSGSAEWIEIEQPQEENVFLGDNEILREETTEPQERPFSEEPKRARTTRELIENEDTKRARID